MAYERLRELEHLVLLATSRLDPPVHGVLIVRELQRTVKRSISRASVYVVLRRLEARGLIVSSMGAPTPERGGRAKRCYARTPLAIRSLRTAPRDFVRLWAGSRVLLLVVAVAIGSAAPHAQTRARAAMPNFSGTWLSVSDPNATDVETASRLPNALLTIAHKGTRFELQRSWSTGPIAATFVCDGTRENQNGYSIVVERTKCRWDPSDGGNLIIEGSIGRADGEVTGRLRERYRIDREGILHVERSREVFATGRSALVATARYRKVTTSGR